MLKPVTIHEYNQVIILLAVDPQIWSHTKHIDIKYHHFQSFTAKYDSAIGNVDTKDQIAEIYTKPLDPELFGYLCQKLMVGRKRLSLFAREYEGVYVDWVYYKDTREKGQYKTQSCGYVINLEFWFTIKNIYSKGV